LMVSCSMARTLSEQRMESGMETAIITVERQLPRKTRIMRPVSAAAISPSRTTAATEDVAAVYDDLTNDLGLVKVSVSGSDAGHNGVASLLEYLGNGFARLRLGIGPRQPPEMDLKDFVLARFTQDQQKLIQQKTDIYVQDLELLLESGPSQAMNKLNRRDIT